MKLVKITRVALPLGLPAFAFIGCAIIPPTGPSVVALPPTGKPMNLFQQEDYACRDFALRSDNIGAPSHDGIAESVGSSAIGTVAGAAAGALFGAATGNAGVGAAIGAGVGLLLGSAVGANGAQATSESMQARYNAAYAQCMASKATAFHSRLSTPRSRSTRRLLPHMRLDPSSRVTRNASAAGRIE